MDDKLFLMLAFANITDRGMIVLSAGIYEEYDKAREHGRKLMDKDSRIIGFDTLEVEMNQPISLRTDAR